MKTVKVEIEVPKEDKKYSHVAYNTFKEIGTKPSEWKPCEFDFENKAHTKFGQFIPDNYNMIITRFSGRITGLETTNCNLCGHIIKNLYYIQNDSKKLVMLVGSSCVESFKLAQKGIEAYKIYVEKQTKEEFDLFVKKLRDWNNNRIKVFIMQSGKNEWLPYNMYSMKEELKDYKMKKINTTRKMKNFIKKYKEVIKNEI